MNLIQKSNKETRNLGFFRLILGQSLQKISNYIFKSEFDTFMALDENRVPRNYGFKLEKSNNNSSIFLIFQYNGKS